MVLDDKLCKNTLKNINTRQDCIVVIGCVVNKYQCPVNKVLSKKRQQNAKHCGKIGVHEVC